MDKGTIERYINNRCTEEERTLVQRWMEQEGDKWYEKYFDEHYHDAQGPAPAATDETVLKMVLQAVKEKQAPVIPLRKKHSYQRWIAAACMVLLAGATWFSLRQSKRKVRDTGNEIVWTQVVNTGEAIRKVLLPDSSLVALNKGAHIRYRQPFEQKDRMVELAGEAFFEVVHDSQRPFIVKAGNATTVVYGTAFNIQANAEEDQLTIALKRGKIGISVAQQAQPAGEKILTPGQLYQYHKKEARIAIASIPPDQIGGWREGGLSFYNTPLKDVITQLERKFEVSFQLSGKVSLGNTFTAYFPAATLEQVLNHLRFTGDWQFRQAGKIIYVE